MVKISDLLKSPEVKWPLIATVSAGVIQYAFYSLFRGSSRCVPLLSRVTHFSGGAALLNLGLPVLIGLTVFAAIRFFKPSVGRDASVHKKEGNPAASKPNTTESKLTGSYEDALVDHYMKTEPGQPEVPFSIQQGANDVAKVTGCQMTILSTYPKTSEGGQIFCDAFGYAVHNERQYVAIADGVGFGSRAQKCARLMVSSFMKLLQQMPSIQTPETIMTVAQLCQQDINLRCSARNYDYSIGDTTFLGGMIHTTNEGKRFSFVNCGDSRLYLLRNGVITHETPLLMTKRSTSNPGGYFGASRFLYRKDDSELAAAATESCHSVEVNPGDQLLLMTDGVDDNLDDKYADCYRDFYKVDGSSENKVPYDEALKAENLAIATRRLEKLQSLYEEATREERPFDLVIMEHVLKHFQKRDHATLLVVTVR